MKKSLGAVAKAGASALEAVYEYAEPIDTKGLCFMDSPGFDPVSITGMVASGANVVVFSTGRGSCHGCKPTPSIKITSNTTTYSAMSDDIDIDGGRIYQGTTVQELGAELFDMIIRVASGEQSKSEKHGIGEEEFSPWSIGPIL